MKKTEFDKDTLIHIVIPASQWDEMWELYQQYNDKLENDRM